MSFVKITPRYLLTFLVLLFFSSLQAQVQQTGSFVSNGTSAPKLAQVYAGNDGGAYYCTESGNKVYCFAEHPGKDYAYVIEGTRSGNTINAKFWGVPKEGATKTGTVKLQVLGNGALKSLAQTGGFPATTFNIKTIASIKDLLPRPKDPAFTTVKLSDLDGGFKDANGFYYYFRQVGDQVVMFCEKDFQKGQQPGGAFVFIGTRQGNGVQGTVVAIPKGVQKGKGNLGLNVLSNGKLSKQSTISFGGNTLNPIIPIQNINIPIASAVDILDSQLKYMEVRLDNYDQDGKELKNGSFVKFKGMDPVNFHIPMLQVTTCPNCIQSVQTYRRSFINDLNTDIIQVKSLGGNKMRLTVIFENDGREIKRYCRQCAGKAGDGGPQDDIMKDWDLQDPRVDIELQLINTTTSSGKPSISFNVTSVKLHAWIDVPGIWDELEGWIAGKVRPEAESRIKTFLNSPKMRTMVADNMYQQLQNVTAYANQYQVLGYNLISLQPKGIGISGSQVVFQFK